MMQFLALFAAGSNSCAAHSFFGLLPWWYYLPAGDFSGCSINSFSPLSASGLPLVLLAVVDDLLRIAGMIAVGFTLYGAVLYITSQGNPDQASKALSTIINALVGVAIAMFAVAFVSFLGNQLRS